MAATCLQLPLTLQCNLYIFLAAHNKKKKTMRNSVKIHHVVLYSIVYPAGNEQKASEIQPAYGAADVDVSQTTRGFVIITFLFATVYY